MCMSNLQVEDLGGQCFLKIGGKSFLPQARWLFFYLYVVFLLICCIVFLCEMHVETH